MNYYSFVWLVGLLVRYIFVLYIRKEIYSSKSPFLFISVLVQK